MNASYLARCEAAAAEQHNKRLERELDILEKKHKNLINIVKQFHIYQMNLKRGTLTEKMYIQLTRNLFSNVKL